MHSVCRCSLSVWRRSFLKKGTPRDLFLPRPGSAPGGIWPKNNNTCKGPWVLHPYQVSSKSIKRFWRRSRICEKFTPDGRRRRTTDGRTDDGRCPMTIAHSSLWLRWAKKETNKDNIMRVDVASNDASLRQRESHFSLPRCHFSLTLLEGEVTSPYSSEVGWALKVSQINKVTKSGINYKGIISRVCMPNMKSLPLTVQIL